MVHIPAKFRQNTSMRFRVTVRKLNMTDGQTDRQRDVGPCNISRPRPSARREITTRATFSPSNMNMDLPNLPPPLYYELWTHPGYLLYYEHGPTRATFSIMNMDPPGLPSPPLL